MRRQVPGLAVARDGLQMGEVGVRAAKHANKALGDRSFVPATIQTISRALLHSVHAQKGSEQRKPQNILFHSPEFIRRQKYSCKTIAKPGPEGSAGFTHRQQAGM